MSTALWLGGWSGKGPARAASRGAEEVEAGKCCCRGKSEHRGSWWAEEGTLKKGVTLLEPG